MSVPIKNEIQYAPATARLQDIAGRLRSLAPVHRQIGELLVESTKRRFATSTAPDGSQWQELSATTIARYVASFGNSFRLKAGRDNRRAYDHTLNAAGQRKRDGRKPLVGESKALSTTIFYEVGADGSLSVGSPMEYSALQQFGQTKGASGTMANGRPIPWGDIPARAFVGLSDDDETMIADKYAEYILEMPFVS